MVRFLRRLLPGLAFVCSSIVSFVSGSAQSTLADQAPVAASTSSVSSPASTLSAVPSRLAEAKMLYRKGSFDAAIAKYQEILQGNPPSPDAYAGLVRTYLKKKDVQQAYDTATHALQVVDSEPIHVALGEVYFRQGRIHDAEEEWVKVINSGRQDARAYFGVARVRMALSMYKSAWTLLDKAHTADPSDPEIQKLWTQRLNRAARIKFLEEYLAGDNNDDAETRTRMQHYLEYLKARANDSRAACQLVSKTTTTETPLVRLLRDPTHLRGYGLSVAVNGHNSKLMLDTGASGILVNRNLAEQAGITRLSDMPVWGVGDKGDKAGYTAVANSLKIGELEFQGCTVRVLEQRSVADEDGLIGGDVFASFLVDIDFPNEKLHLSELPRRPEENNNPLKLKTEEDDPGQENKDSKNDAAPTTSKETKPTQSGPQDRYIAPEMKSYTQVLRFGHMLLVPTAIGEVPGKLFLLDSGAFTNSITPAAAREVTKIHGDPRVTVKGLSGTVKSVYSADRAVLQFGHLREENQDLIAFDLTHMSDHTGTEISGILGFTLLRLLDVKIDYRDGLVDFSYNPKR